MIQSEVLAIGIGLATSLLLSEVFALSAGGMVTAGYVALYLDSPTVVLMTLIVSAVTVLIVRALSKVAFVYGKRRFVATILIAFLLGSALRMLSMWLAGDGARWAQVLIGEEGTLQTVWFIVPGLIALWIDRQGALPTICGLLTAAVVVRLVLVLILGPEVLPPMGAYGGTP